MKLSPLQHCLRRIPLSGTSLTLRERINYFGEKGSRYWLPPPRLLETGENSFSSVFLAFFSLAYFSELERICIFIVSQRRTASTSSLFLFSIATSSIVFLINSIYSLSNRKDVLSFQNETRASRVIITSKVDCSEGIPDRSYNR